jgi:hypothetical protein
MTSRRAFIESSIAQLEVQICDAPRWPADPVLVMDFEQTRHSHMVWPRFLPYTLRSKLPTWIADVATYGNSGSGVFAPNRKCLLGIMSRKYMAADKDIAKYFAPAAQIRGFVGKLSPIADDLKSCLKRLCRVQFLSRVRV